jgi:hypothetical protein
MGRICFVVIIEGDMALIRLVPVLILLISFVAVTLGQKVKLSGIVFDYNGAVVPIANVRATSAKSVRHVSAVSNDEGVYQLELQPGLYSLEVSRDGFLTLGYSEYLVVNASAGMKLDFVMFGAMYHEPCGPAGAPCLHSRQLIKEFKVKYTPSLKELIEDFTDLNKQKNNK